MKQSVYLLLIGSISLGQAIKINTFDAYDVEIGGGDESALMEVADKDQAPKEDTTLVETKHKKKGKHHTKRNGTDTSEADISSLRKVQQHKTKQQDLPEDAEDTPKKSHKKHHKKSKHSIDDEMDQKEKEQVQKPQPSKKNNQDKFIDKVSHVMQSGSELQSSNNLSKKSSQQESVPYQGEEESDKSEKKQAKMERDPSKEVDHLDYQKNQLLKKKHNHIEDTQEKQEQPHQESEHKGKHHSKHVHHHQVKSKQSSSDPMPTDDGMTAENSKSPSKLSRDEEPIVSPPKSKKRASVEEDHKDISDDGFDGVVKRGPAPKIIAKDSMDSQEHPRALKKESVKTHHVPVKSITKEASDDSEVVVPKQASNDSEVVVRKHEPKPTYKSIKQGQVGDKDAQVYGVDTKDILTKGHKHMKHHSKGYQAEHEEQEAKAPKDLDSEEAIEKEATTTKKLKKKTEVESDDQKSSSSDKKVAKKEDDPNGINFEAPKIGKPFPDESGKQFPNESNGDDDEGSKATSKKLSAIEVNQEKDMEFENKQVDDTDKALEELENEEKAPASKPFVKVEEPQPQYLAQHTSKQMTGSEISKMTKTNSKSTSAKVTAATVWSQSASQTDAQKEDKWAKRRAMTKLMKSNWGTAKSGHLKK